MATSTTASQPQHLSEIEAAHQLYLKRAKARRQERHKELEATKQRVRERAIGSRAGFLEQHAEAQARKQYEAERQELRAARDQRISVIRDQRISKVLESNKEALEKSPLAKQATKRQQQRGQAEATKLARIQSLRKQARRQARRGHLIRAAKTAIKAPIVAQLEFWKRLAWYKLAAFEPITSTIALAYLNVYAFLSLQFKSLRLRWWEKVALLLVDMVFLFVLVAILVVFFALVDAVSKILPG